MHNQVSNFPRRKDSFQYLFASMYICIIGAAAAGILHYAPMGEMFLVAVFSALILAMGAIGVLVWRQNCSRTNNSEDEFEFFSSNVITNTVLFAFYELCGIVAPSVLLASTGFSLPLCIILVSSAVALTVGTIGVYLELTRASQSMRGPLICPDIPSRWISGLFSHRSGSQASNRVSHGNLTRRAADVPNGLELRSANGLFARPNHDDLTHSMGEVANDPELRSTNGLFPLGTRTESDTVRLNANLSATR